MRDDVLILLNEREPMKAGMAAALEEQLLARHYATERLRPGPETADVLLSRAPRVVVSDYLLGEHATVLDLLDELSDKNPQAMPAIIIWTDEPSVQVAVTALKRGVKDYLEMGLPRSLERTVTSVEQLLREKKAREEKRAPAKPQKISPVIYQGAKSQPVLEQASTFARANSGLLLICGPRGAGRNALARYIHAERPRGGSLLEIAYDTWDGSPDDFGSALPGAEKDFLSSGATVFIDHAEWDPEPLLHQAEALLAQHRQNPLREYFIVGSSSPEFRSAWVRLLDAPVVEIPPLSSRPEDFLPIAQQVAFEVQRIVKGERRSIPTELITFLRSLDWPGNVRQFRAVLHEAFMSPADETELERLVREAMARWERYQEFTPAEPSPARARRALEAAGGNIRFAAALLGTGVPQIRRGLLAVDAPSSEATGRAGAKPRFTNGGEL